MAIRAGMRGRRPVTEQRRAAVDDVEAARFARLVPAHAPAMLRAAAALVGMADAEDATQEAVVRAWRAWTTLRDETALRGWLLTITVNVCRQWRRGGFGRRLRLMEPLPAGDSQLLAQIESDPGASDHTGALDLRAAVNRLPEDLRVVVALRYYGGMDATEAGEALGVPPATVRTRLRRAMLALRDEIGAGYRDGAFQAARGEGEH